MTRKHDAHKEELEGVAQRLRNERPEASPLQLDQIKTSAMSRAKAGTRRRSAGARRLATAGLTIGLLAAGTGGVIAGGAGGHHGNGGSNASNTQYGGECNITNGNGNVGDNGMAPAPKTNACNENTFINEDNTHHQHHHQHQHRRHDRQQLLHDGQRPTGGDQQCSGSQNDQTGTQPARHQDPPEPLAQVAPEEGHPEAERENLQGAEGQAASKNIKLTNLPCSGGATTITVVAVTSTGKTVTESHTYHLCQA